MSADKRTVATDALETLGTVIGTNEKRDAIHLGVEPIEAAIFLDAGDHVGIKDGKAGDFYPRVGIVDPFLERRVRPGEHFWLVVYPRQITSLRHVWEHPDFPASTDVASVSTDKAASEAWLQDFATRSDCPGYHALMAKAEDFCDDGGGEYSDEYLHFSGSAAHGEIPPEFWIHFEIVTGKKPSGEKATYFSCSC